jgi:hypothetical protein
MHREIPHPLEGGFGMTGVFGEGGGRSGDSPIDLFGLFSEFHPANRRILDYSLKNTNFK